MELTFYTSVVNIVAEIMATTQSALFTGAKSCFDNALSTIILGLVATFWVYTKMGTEWNRQDFYKAGIWIAIYVFLKSVFSSYDNYLGFLQLVDTPIKWVYGSLSSAGVNDITQGMDKAFTHLGNIISTLWDKIELKKLQETIIYIVPIIFIGLVGTLNIIWIALFSIVTKFTVALVLSLCPLVLPCLAINQLRGYFFSWFKLYISVSLYIPLASVIGNLTTKGMELFTTSDTTKITEIFNTTFGIVIVAILSIFTISQIPNFIQQIIGASGGVMGTGMTIISTNFAKNYSESRNSINANTGQKNSVLRSALAGGVGAVPGLSGVSQKIMGRDSASVQQSLQNGNIKASPTPYSNKLK